MSRRRHKQSRNRHDRRVQVFTDISQGGRQSQVSRFLTTFGLDQARLEAEALHDHTTRRPELDDETEAPHA